MLVFGVVQLIQETVLVSRFQGEAMGLSPAIILLSISIWGKLLGFLGLILALPLTCLGLTYYRRVRPGSEIHSVLDPSSGSEINSPLRKFFCG